MHKGFIRSVGAVGGEVSLRKRDPMPYGKYGTGDGNEDVPMRDISAIYGGLGYAWVFAYIAACWAVVALTVALLGPSSGGTVLEELQETEPTGRFSREELRNRSGDRSPSLR